jgi:hypothetical protein
MIELYGLFSITIQTTCFQMGVVVPRHGVEAFRVFTTVGLDVGAVVGVGAGVGTGVAVAIGVGVGVGLEVAVGVTLGVGVGEWCGLWEGACARAGRIVTSGRWEKLNTNPSTNMVKATTAFTVLDASAEWDHHHAYHKDSYLDDFCQCRPPASARPYTQGNQSVKQGKRLKDPRPARGESIREPGYSTKPAPACRDRTKQGPTSRRV